MGYAESAIESACALAAAGIAVHWLRPRSKVPLSEGEWQRAPVATPAELVASQRPDLNVGIRLGTVSKVAGQFLHVIDLDIRASASADEAHARLHELMPEYKNLPFVISGSGGESRHFYVLTERPFRSRKLAHSKGRHAGKDGKQHWDWEIELFGTGKQVVVPPSIHPDSGLAYRWGRPLDVALIEMGLGDTIAADRVQGWGVGTAGAALDDDDALLAQSRAKPMGLSEAEVLATLKGLPFDEWCEDRDGWMTVGMALHHEFEGSKKGLEVWNVFSKRSTKFDHDDQARVWRSFQDRLNPVRMATLIKAAGLAEIEQAHDEGTGFDDLTEHPDPEIDDLIGHAADAPVNREWRSRLDLNEDGVLKLTLHNLTLITGNDPRTKGIEHLNLFTGEVVKRSTPGKLRPKKPSPKGTKQLEGKIWTLRDRINGDPWTDAHDNAIRDLLEAPKRQGGYGLKVTDRDLKAAIDIVARQNSFHPIQDYLSALKWDLQPRLETVFIRYMGTKDSAYTRDVTRLTFLGAVARVWEPGHKFDFVTIFEGKQGKRKSTFIEIMGRSWSGELRGDFSDRKKMVEKMQGCWILELPDLSGFRRAEVEEIKAFVSARSDKDRLSYDHRAQRFLRQCIFLGSSNRSDYLRDDTGGRRFWPIPTTIEEIDTDAFEREVDQVWAEAFAIYQAMRAKQPAGTLPLYLTGVAAREEALEMQESRRAETPEDMMAGKIEAWLAEPERDASGFDDDDDLIGPPVARNEVCLIEIWVECLGNDLRSYTGPQAYSIGRAMRQIAGWWSPPGSYRTEKYGKQRVYRRLGTRGRLEVAKPSK